MSDTYNKIRKMNITSILTSPARGEGTRLELKNGCESNVRYL